MRKILRMKKLFVCMAVVLAVAIGFGSWSVPVAAAQQTFNLKAVWNPNAEPDMAGYHFFDTTLGPGMYKAWKGAGVWGADASNPVALPVSPTQLLFTISVPDTPSTGTLKFEMSAFDTNNNESAKCPDALYSYNIDTTPPAVPTGLVISKQP